MKKYILQGCLLSFFCFCVSSFIYAQEEATSKIVSLLVGKGFTPVSIVSNRVLLRTPVDNIESMLDNIKSSAFQLHSEDNVPVTLYPNTTYCQNTGTSYWATVDQVGDSTAESLSIYSLHSKALTILPGSLVPGNQALARSKIMHQEKLIELFKQPNTLIVCLDESLVVENDWNNLSEKFEEGDVNNWLSYVSLKNKYPYSFPSQVSSKQHGWSAFSKISLFCTGFVFVGIIFLFWKK